MPTLYSTASISGKSTYVLIPEPVVVRTVQVLHIQLQLYNSQKMYSAALWRPTFYRAVRAIKAGAGRTGNEAVVGRTGNEAGAGRTGNEAGAGRTGNEAGQEGLVIRLGQEGLGTRLG